MNFGRIVDHLLSTQAQVLKAFGGSFDEIEAAIKRSETLHSGEICFLVEAGYNLKFLVEGKSARQRAEELFCERRIWDTEFNNGVLIYLMLADRNIEIVVDRGLCRYVDQAEWERICQLIEDSCRHGDLKGGVIRGIEEVSLHLARFFPGKGDQINAIGDRPVVL